jgi:phosphatidylglycerophosphatase A
MNPINLANKVWQDPAYFLAFGFGSGLSPFAPGTFGTLAAMPLYLIVSSVSFPLYMALCVVFFALGVYVSNQVTNDLGVHDYKGIVWDEVVGYLLTMCCAPKGYSWMLLGFLLFRLFDIWKPMPISLVDKNVKGGLGIMLDDVLAAFPSFVIIQLLAWRFA